MNLDRKAVKLCEQVLKSNGDRISDKQYTVVRMRTAEVMSKLLPEADDALKKFVGEHSMWVLAANCLGWLSLPEAWSGHGHVLFDHRI